jgi:hypothetical protein
MRDRSFGTFVPNERFHNPTARGLTSRDVILESDTARVFWDSL